MCVENFYSSVMYIHVRTTLCVCVCVQASVMRFTTTLDQRLKNTKKFSKTLPQSTALRRVGLRLEPIPPLDVVWNGDVEVGVAHPVRRGRGRQKRRPWVTGGSSQGQTREGV